MVEELRQRVLVGHKGEFRAKVFEKDLDEVVHQSGVRPLGVFRIEKRCLMSPVVCRWGDRR